VLLERQQHPEEGCFRQVDTLADLLEGDGNLAVEAIQNVESAADGAEVILLISGGGIA
jgi:hypothetical protein